jgi:hypothetical protein
MGLSFGCVSILLSTFYFLSKSKWFAHIITVKTSVGEGCSSGLSITPPKPKRYSKLSPKALYFASIEVGRVYVLIHLGNAEFGLSI